MIVDIIVLIILLGAMIIEGDILTNVPMVPWRKVYMRVAVILQTIAAILLLYIIEKHK